MGAAENRGNIWTSVHSLTIVLPPAQWEMSMKKTPTLSFSLRKGRVRGVSTFQLFEGLLEAIVLPHLSQRTDGTQHNLDA